MAISIIKKQNNNKFAICHKRFFLQMQKKNNKIINIDEISQIFLSRYERLQINEKKTFCMKEKYFQRGSKYSTAHKKKKKIKCLRTPFASMQI